MGPSLGLSTTKKQFPQELLDFNMARQRFSKRMDALLNNTSYDQEPSLGTAFLNAFSSLFAPQKPTDHLRWAIYLIGHGGQEKKGIRYEILNEVIELQQTIEDDQEKLAKELDALFIEKRKLERIKNARLLQQLVQKRERRINELKKNIESDTERLNVLLRSEKKTENVEPSLASLSLAEFKTFLSYLSHTINTTVFAYMTCFAAGSNLYKVYQHDQERNIIDNYPFVIGSAGISAGITEAPGVTDFDNYPPEETAKDIRNYKKPMVKAIANYDLFFSLCEKDAPVDWAQAFNAIFAYTKFPKDNLPLVKFPGTPWFMVPALKDEIVSLSSVIAATREPHEELVLENQKAILVYAPEIPFSIRYAPRISAGKIKEVPVYISMIPGYAHHAFTSIYAPEYEASRVLKSFFSYPEEQDEKIFSIDNLEVTNDILPEIRQKTITLQNVFCINHAQTLGLANMFASRAGSDNMVCFSLNGQAYGWKWPQDGDILFSAHAPEKIDPRYEGLIYIALGGSRKYKVKTRQEKSYTPAKTEFTPAKRELIKKVLEKKIEEMQQKTPQPKQSTRMKKSYTNKKITTA